MSKEVREKKGDSATQRRQRKHIKESERKLTFDSHTHIHIHLDTVSSTYYRTHIWIGSDRDS